MDLSRILAALVGQSSAGDMMVIWEIRLPRAVAAFVVGAALGISGAGLQGLLRNPLAEPGVLGVTATSSLAATFTLYYGVAASWPYSLCHAHKVRCDTDLAWRRLVQFLSRRDVTFTQPGAQSLFTVRYDQLVIGFSR